MTVWDPSDGIAIASVIVTAAGVAATSFFSYHLLKATRASTKVAEQSVKIAKESAEAAADFNRRALELEIERDKIAKSQHEANQNHMNSMKNQILQKVSDDADSILDGLKELYGESHTTGVFNNSIFKHPSNSEEMSKYLEPSQIRIINDAWNSSQEFIDKSWDKHVGGYYILKRRRKDDQFLSELAYLQEKFQRARSLFKRTFL